MNRFPLQHPRIACLWFPNWPIQRRVVSQPELRKQHVILFARDARRGQLVAAASPLAMREGISVAMPLAEAKALLSGTVAGSPSHGGGVTGASSHSRRNTARTSSHGHFLSHKPSEDIAALEAMADSLESHSPIVGLESFDELRPAKRHSPECLFMDVTGLAHLFGDEQRLAQLTLQHCQQAGYLVRIAIADTLGMAWALARYHREALTVTAPEVASLAGVARLQVSRATPPPSNTDLKQQLPVSALRLPNEMVDTLGQLGIRTIGQLERLPRPELAMRFGHAIGLRLDQLNGVADEAMVARRLPVEFEAHQSLDFPTHHRDTIEAIATGSVQTICEQLRSRQRGALQWRFTLDRVEGQPIEFTIRLFQATATPADVLPLLTMHLEQALQPHTHRFRKKYFPKRPSAKQQPNAESSVEANEQSKSKPAVQLVRTMSIDIRDVTVAVTASGKLVHHQRRLFDENPRADPQAMASLINRLTSRLGANNVVCTKLQSDAQPEYAFRLQPLVDARLRRPTRSRKTSHLFARPLRLFHPPRPLQATSGPATSSHDLPSHKFRGTNISRPPAVLIYESDPVLESSGGNVQVKGEKPNVARTTQKATRTWGPERIETGWWRGHTTCRDYWRVETEAGKHLWVFRDLRRQKWFVQGEF